VRISDNGEGIEQQISTSFERFYRVNKVVPDQRVDQALVWQLKHIIEAHKRKYMWKVNSVLDRILIYA
jgi:signal transduction histidine kinase